MKTETVHLKLAKNHPNHAFMVLDIKVQGYEYKPYEISEAHVNDLQSEGVKHWVSCKELLEDETPVAETPVAEMIDENKVIEDAAPKKKK